MSTLIDGHVHFHSVFSLTQFLSGAVRNFRNSQAAPEHTTGVLMLAKTDTAPPLSRIEGGLSSVESTWQTSRPDATSYVFKNQDATIIVIAGRQIVTQENLELLALCSNASMSSDLPLQEAILQATEKDAVPVVPWGFGKWWFARGKVLQTLLESQLPPTFLIGDSGCRPALGSSPLMQQAHKMGVANLAGSDPLPIRQHENRAGSFGTVLPGTVDLSQPTAWVRERLIHLKREPTFGQRRTLLQFVDDQLRIRIAKHR